MASKRKKYRRARKESIRFDKSDDEIDLATSLAACIREKMLEAETGILDRKSIEIISQAVSIKNLPLYHRRQHKRQRRNYKPGKKGISHGKGK
jgi:hypothetical protein